MNKFIRNTLFILIFGLALAPVLIIHAEETSHAPTWGTLPTQAGFVGKLISFRLSPYDKDRDVLTVRMVSGPDGAYFDPELKQFAWIPKTYQLGNFQATFSAYDGIYTINKTVLIVVSETSPLPASLRSVAYSNSPYDVFGVLRGSTKVSAQAKTSAKKSTIKNDSTADKLAISNLTAKRSGSDVIVSWSTNSDATERIIYDNKSELSKKDNFTYSFATAEKTDNDKKHSIRLTGLKPGETYYMRAVSKDGKTSVISSELAFGLNKDVQAANASSQFGENVLLSPFFYIALIVFICFVIYQRKKNNGSSSEINSGIPTVADIKI